MPNKHWIDLAEEKSKLGKIREFLRQERIGEIQKIVLSVVGLAGLLSVAVITPNAVQAFARLGIIPGHKKKVRIKQAYEKLISSGHLIKDREGFVRLTEKGERRMIEFELRGAKLTRSEKWDGHWRILIFDISEKKRLLRDRMRRTLISLGFRHLQDSVWIYPYDCTDIISLLKKDFEIGKDLIYMTSDKIEYDGALRKHFGL
ncbi:MAG: hypothetical protein A3G59_00665 [Candidatus Taylorbacteria bacterium RIFCSPLOWO2_12_FULL_47_20]|uniref:Transcriptional repressor PaaX-like central Cas2-like domain-containing protein n=2 Tax=Candidatus Tayloriibacteriota TaxID=1817919 RepID=A0A1G2P718_9BACT|nr:MAG: hypothetical protein A3H68_01230 [Candidatus Taylorbacteria bacterium RIFCSPLOWO2_02_FULL_46_40]OHA44154.1 MAG: hypothetical protein A3G59_00665 [Candidatus Taylorbacteria bacterium RIFCSPLOWO2_12_FULL_47_20]